ncbi:hypothetical protein EZV62_017467 [Acer yangbiense]|uniref:SGNH hydrolase-type esterase domain-containing protein n=1 Tax=Acer yangbiense TaxID=1000413 RepID=A0A5C7HGR0_9ROSI|nr:hypothetical protein EZV62_017467 [Acer yangbiense]
MDKVQLSVKFSQSPVQTNAEEEGPLASYNKGASLMTFPKTERITCINTSSIQHILGNQTKPSCSISFNKMINSNTLFLQITLSILFLSFSLSYAHPKPPPVPSDNIYPSQPSIPVAPPPQTTISSNPPINNPSQPSIPAAAVVPSNPDISNPSQPSIPAAEVVPSSNINPSQPSIPEVAAPQLSTPVAATPQVQLSNQAASTRTATATASSKYNGSFSASFKFNGSFSASFNYNGSFNKVFAFGDSFTDTGNAYLLGGLKSTFFGSLFSRFANSFNSSSQLSGNRQSNGRLVVDFLCDSLNIPYLPPYKQTKVNFSHGANFAIAGATSLSANFFNQLKNNNNAKNANLMWKGIPSSFQTQLDWFNKFLQEKECNKMTGGACKSDMENSLFWIGGMGRNDYARTLGAGSTFQIPRLKEMTVAYISKFLQTLTESGAKYIVVQGLPPVGCCPLELFLTKSTDRDNMGCASLINGIIKTHNELLQKMLANFQKKNTHCTVVYADYWNAYKTILENHNKFNFEEPFKACCGAGGGALNFNSKSTCGTSGTSACKDPSRYISWDGVHFTEAMHRTIADLFLNQGFCKPSFDTLIKMKGGMSAKGGGDMNMKV